MPHRVPLRFLLQVYAPINDDPRAFHRAVYVFISPRGSALGAPGTVRAFRSQLPRANAYYPFEPPEAHDRPRRLSAAAQAVASNLFAVLSPAADRRHLPQDLHHSEQVPQAIPGQLCAARA